MSFPEPKPGLVFRYDYLWEQEARRGSDSSKDRPACIAVTVDPPIEPRLVVILPITHSKPSGGAIGVEIPADIRRYLKLDDERCWIIVSEANLDIWPNAGITPLLGGRGGFTYGTLPRGLFATVKKKMLQHFDIKRSVRR